MVFPIIDAVALIFRTAFLAKVQKAAKGNLVDVEFDFQYRPVKAFESLKP